MSHEQPEKLDLRSHDIAEDKRQELLRLFPEVRTESGKLDFERLKLALGEAADAGKERYGMNWPGKADCFKAIQTPSLGTLISLETGEIDWANVSYDGVDAVILEYPLPVHLQMKPLEPLRMRPEDVDTFAKKHVFVVTGTELENFLQSADLGAPPQ